MRKRNERINKIADGLEELIDGYACINLNDDVDTKVLSLLEKLTGDNEECISWWLYEDVEKIVTVTKNSSINKSNEDIQIEIKNYEDLYDYLHYFA